MALPLQPVALSFLAASAASTRIGWMPRLARNAIPAAPATSASGGRRHRFHRPSPRQTALVPLPHAQSFFVPIAVWWRIRSFHTPWLLLVLPDRSPIALVDIAPGRSVLAHVGWRMPGRRRSGNSRCARLFRCIAVARRPNRWPIWANKSSNSATHSSLRRTNCFVASSIALRSNVPWSKYPGRSIAR
jgi:hypothetical protein